MSAYLNGQPITGETLTPDITVGQVVEKAKARLNDTGDIIFSVICNENEVPADRLDEVLSQPLSAFSRVELISGRPEELVLEALRETRRSFSDSFATIKQAAQDMTAGNLAKGMAGLVECLGVWSNVHETIVQGGALVDIDFDRLVIDGRHILDWLNDLSTKLKEIKSAIESRDNVLLADMLSYEMDEIMQGWESVLHAFVEQVKRLDRGAVDSSNTPALAATQ